tara:strand:+ start:262 stop:516 length:255 start_codon:yes stop_codon:yes gene_type:complete
MNEKFLKNFIDQLNDALPSLESELGLELRQQLRAALMRAFERLDLVTREEFDAQNAVLMRSREKIDQLEEQLTDLSTKLNAENH